MIQKKTAQKNGSRPARSRNNTERKRAEERAQLCAEIINRMQVGVNVWRLEDPNDLGSFRLVLSNPAAAQLSGVPREDVLGKTVAESYPASLEMEALRVFAEVIRSGEPKDLGEFRYSDERIPEAVFAMTAFPLPNNCVGVTFQNVIERTRAEEASRRRTHDLGERFKELTCLHRLSNLVQNPGISVEEILQGTTALLRSAWQYPKTACARIIFEGREFATDNFRETPWRQSSDIVVHGERSGIVEVCYLEERPERDEGPFLKQERILIDAVAERLGRVVERKRAEEALRASEMTYREIFNAVNEGILVLDMETGAIVDANTTFCNVLGYAPEETRGLRVEEFSSGEAPYIQEDALRLIRKAARGQPQRFEWLAKDRDGRALWIDVNLKRATIAGRHCVLAIGRDITQRKQAEEALRESETKFRTLTESEAASIFIYRGTRPLYVNAAMEELTGYTREEILAGELWQFVHPDSQSLARERSRARQQGEEAPSRYEFKIVTKSGEERWVDFTAGIIEFEGQPAAIGTAYDITERKRAEQAMRESEERYRLLAENVTDVIWTADMDLNLTYVSPSVVRLQGYSPDEIIALPLEQIMTPDSLNTVRKALAEGLAVESREQQDLSSSRTLELEELRKDGSTVWVEMKVTFLRDPDGRPTGILGVTRDITERKRAEDALRASEATYRSIFNATNDAIVVHDMETGQVIDANAAFLGRQGCTLGEARQLKVVPEGPIEAPYTQEDALRWIHKAASGRPQRSEWLSRDRDGRPIWLDVSLRRATIAGQDRVLVVSRDITERKQAEEALRETTHTLQALVQASPLAVITVDQQGNVRSWNPAAERTFGWSEQEALGRPNPIIPEDRQDEFRAYLDAVLQGNLLNQVEARRLRKDGSLIDVSLSTAPMRNATGDVIGTMGIIADITERKRAEEALRESERRFRALSESSFEGIAIHRKGRILEANQPLAAMFGYELSEIIGMHALDFAAPESRDLLLQNIASGYREPVELTGLRKDGTTFPVEVCGRPIPYQGMMVTVASLQDITAHKQAEEALQKAREELEARAEREMERGNPYGLTFRELTVLHLAATGKADKEIGGQLGITTLTASKHLANILSKMGAASRTEASVRALREGLLD